MRALIIQMKTLQEVAPCHQEDFIQQELGRAGFDLRRRFEKYVDIVRGCVSFTQEDHATMDDIMDTVGRLEKLLNIPDE